MWRARGSVTIEDDLQLPPLVADTWRARPRSPRAARSGARPGETTRRTMIMVYDDAPTF